MDVRLLATPEVATGPAPAVAVDGGPSASPSDCGSPAGRPVHVVIRRRRVLSVLLSAATLLTLAGAVPDLRALWWPAAVLGLLAVCYLALVARISHLQERRDMARAFGQVDLAGEFDWQELGLELDSPPAPTTRMRSGCRWNLAIENSETSCWRTPWAGC